MSKHELDRTVKHYSPGLRGMLARLTDWMLGRNRLVAPSPDEWRTIARDALHDSGTDAFLEQYSNCKDSTERKRLMADWEEKMALRKVERSTDQAPNR